MKHSLSATFLAICIAPAARAQDMPLSQILIDGEGWKQTSGDRALSPHADPTTTSPDGSTTFRWKKESARFVEARQTGAEQSVPFAPYCQLRIKGDKPHVTSLIADRDGRIYAGTPLGVQVFDPTGRLCGVILTPSGAPPSHLEFEGDRLTIWVGVAKYERKLKTTGLPRGTPP